MKYLGEIQTKAHAKNLAKMLRENNGTRRAIDCAKLIERNPEWILSRPARQPEIIAMANTTGFAVENILKRIVPSCYAGNADKTNKGKK